ncbi:MAG: D-sedoheptulose-7-phosphate isomerase [Streptosporangiaceae bacterium]
MASEGSVGGAGGVEALYPFLYEGQADLDAVLKEVTESTAAKAKEIVAVREQVLERYADELMACAEQMATRFAAGGRLFACGNGGSSTDAQELATTFLQAARGGRPLPALSLTNDISVVTALSNDIDYDVVFARQIAAFGRRDDIAVCMSTSGNSANLVAAFEEANRRGLLTVGLAGYEGGTMAELDTIDYLFVVSSASVHRIQEAQTTIYHALWELTQRAFEMSSQEDQRPPLVGPNERGRSG